MCISYVVLVDFGSHTNCACWRSRRFTIRLRSTWCDVAFGSHPTRAELVWGQLPPVSSSCREHPRKHSATGHSQAPDPYHGTVCPAWWETTVCRSTPSRNFWKQSCFNFLLLPTLWIRDLTQNSFSVALMWYIYKLAFFKGRYNNNNNNSGRQAAWEYFDITFLCTDSLLAPDMSYRYTNIHSWL